MGGKNRRRMYSTKYMRDTIAITWCWPTQRGLRSANLWITNTVYTSHYAKRRKTLFEIQGNAPLRAGVWSTKQKVRFALFVLRGDPTHVLTYEAPRTKISDPAHGEKCPKTNLESQSVLWVSYRLVVLITVSCTKLAHKKGSNVPCIPKQGYRPNIHMSV